MSSSLRSYLDTLQAFPATVLANPQQYFSKPGRDFTRHRSLWLERVVWLTISLLKVTLFVELDRFFSTLDTDEASVSKSALVQARKKLLPKFFEDMFTQSYQAFYAAFVAKRWKGFRLWATDGTGFRLPNETWLGKAFGWHENQHNTVPSARLLMCYDLYNAIITRAKFHTRKVAESVVALKAINEIATDVLMVYDRGFAGHIIPFLHQHFGSNCVIRIPVGFSNTVKSFVKSGKQQTIITERLQYKARKTLLEMGIAVDTQTTITYRLIRIILSTGETEVLLTTLLDKKRFRWVHFAEIYRLRWGIETCFFVIKSYFELANFSTYTTNNCWQDIYSHFILYNIQTVLSLPLQPQIKRINARRKFDYQANRNVSAGLLKRFLIKFFLSARETFKEHYASYCRQILQSLEPLRPGKNKERRRRLMRGTERHIHEPSYRRAL
ncbi:MAG: IS4 family transposase [Saprospiraceae bacterium]|nr:IS4 family transposase [Saprospiraceae bacterium]